MNPTYKSTDVLHFSIMSTGLQDFAFFEQAHLLKRTPILPPLELLTYDSQWRFLAKLLPPPPGENLGLRYVQVYKLFIHI
jgi:hypothetical protein